MAIANRYFSSLAGDYAASVMTCAEIRLANFQRLLKEFDADEGGAMSGPKFAELLGITPVYVWQLKKGKRAKIDEIAARKIERKLGKPRGWMDNDPTFWPFADIDLDRVQRLGKPARDKLEGALLLVSIQLGLEIKRIAA